LKRKKLLDRWIGRGGTTYRLLDCIVIYLYYSISLSEVKEIVRKVGADSQNGNCGREFDRSVVFG
jgi:hypothetical protein